MKSKPTKSVDPRGNLLNTLSTASELLNDVRNTISGTVTSNSLGVNAAGFMPGSAMVGDTVNMTSTIDMTQLNGVTGTTGNIGCNGTNGLPSSAYYNYVLPQQSVDPGYPKVDIYERQLSWTTKETKETGHVVTKKGVRTGYKIEIFVAGTPKENVRIELNAGTHFGIFTYAPTITVHLTKDESRTDNNRIYFLKESKASATSRTVSLPGDADIEHTSEAKYENGVLSFHILRLEQTPEKPVPVQVKIQ
jgi:HSP20 family molecular chaperone IbpA